MNETEREIIEDVYSNSTTDESRKLELRTLIEIRDLLYKLVGDRLV